MHEVFLNPEHIEIWDATCDGKMPDWRALLSGYAATLDAPACLYWRELANCFPSAKALLIRRDPESWYESMLSTTYQVVMGPKGETERALAMVKRVLFKGYFKGRFEDKEYAISKYRQYCKEVRESISEERLLDYEVSQGWDPLCELLDYGVPDEPFPMKNTRERFQARNRL